MKCSVLVALCLSIATAAALAEPSTGPATTQAKDGGETVAVKRADIRCTIDLDGYLEPVDGVEVRIRPKQYQGELVVISAADHGAKVTKGQTVLQIEDDDINRMLASAENELNSAKANAAKADADVKLGDESDALAMKMQKTDLDNATKAVDWFEKVDGKQMLRQAELSVRNAKNNVEDQQDELDQLKKMYKSEELTNATADIVVKRALRSLDLSKIGLEMYQERQGKVQEFDHLNQRQKLLYVADQQKEALAALVASQEQAKVLRQTALTTAKLALEKCERKVAELKADRDLLTIKAPQDGVVLCGQLKQGSWQNADPRTLRAGEKVAAGQVLMTFFVPTKLRAMIDVPESKVNFVSSGLAARVVPLALPEAATKGVCQSPSPSGQPREGGQTFATSVELSSVDPALTPGEKVAVHIDAKEVKDALSVPLAAVSRGRVRTKGADGKDQWRDVTTGVSDSELIEIKSGLSEGDEVYAKAGK